jgi:putative ATP-dependent endonuclease of OLD family
MARELLRVTYLQPLRDAYRNMQAGRHSRLSQIIQGIPNVNAGVSQATSGMKLEDFNKLSLTGIADLSNKLLSEHSGIKNIVTEINSAMTSKLLLKGDNVKTNIEVSGTDASEERKINALLEKLDLTATTVDKAGHVGLGTSNLLSMACELLLNKNPGSFLLLIEEPEAHIHPQRQIRLIKTLQQDSANPATHQQIIITTHSNILASVVKLENIIIVQKEKAFSLQPEFTKLAKDDYAYLERFLDATKANLFFARAVMIVEGTAEELLLPTLAHLLGKDFAEYGVSTVNVGAIGLNRYARIFQRKDESNLLEVKVACVTDRDVMPNCAPSICLNDSYCDKSKWPLENKRRWKVESDFLQPGEAETYLNKIKERADGQNVKTFIADNWTLEYDLAFSGLQEEMMQAIANVKFGEDSSESKLKEIREEYNKKQTPEERASYLYSFFSKNKVSKACAAQELAAILESKYKNNDDELKKLLPVYLVNAINYVTESDDDA